MRKIAIIAAGFLILGGGLYFLGRSVVSKATALPDNSPAVCHPGFSDRPVVVALGDSITHGRVSANYVDLLAARYPQFRFINAGINSELAWNALQRIDQVLACSPAFVTVLIGTNDVNAKFSTKDEDRYIRNMHLPRRPDREWYEENLGRIAERLRSSKVKTAFLSLPPIGENAATDANARVQDYNRIIERTARNSGAAYLPLFERMAGRLKGRPDNGLCRDGSHPIEAAVARHYLLGQTWNQAGAANGFYLLTDCLHLSENGADVVAELIGDFLTHP